MNIDKIVEMAQSSQSMMSRRMVRSAMTPIVLVCLSSPCCFLFAYLLRDDVFLSRLLGIVGVFPILVACAMYVYFAVTKTDKLQSEDYQIRQELLQMVSSKGGKIKIEPISIETIARPDTSAIEEAERGEK
jgi:hypothetical protein